MTSLSYTNDKDSYADAGNATGRHGSQVDRIIRAIAEAIVAGRLTPDQRLPSVRTTAADHGVSRDTVQRAYDKLVAGGHVHVRRGAGFYVSAPAPSRADPIAPPQVDLAPFQLIHPGLPPDRCPGSGVLRHDDSSVEEIGRVLKRVAGSRQRLGSYGDPSGYLPLREELQKKLQIEGVDTTVSMIMTVPGCVAGLSLIIRSFVRHGDFVVVEDPASFAHVSALLAQGAAILRVPREPDGPDLDVLRLLCERYRPRMFLLMSLLHNPTGGSLSLSKARKLIELAAEFDITLVDDASYADLKPSTAGPPTVPLIVLDQVDRVIHVGGSSHILAPELGTGYIVASERYMPMLRLYRPLQGMGNMLIQERVLYSFLHEGLFRRRCDRIRLRLAEEAAVVRQLFSSTPFQPAMAVGGMFLWVDLGSGVNVTAVAERMLAKGYLTAPGSHFRESKAVESRMRFNVTTTTAAAVEALVESVHN
ncbi:hypothetical protein ASE67_03220 [Sphingomonas sp. Leaf23]|uniref:aminotransferase-like domain-containing protein n=1 Tax=Sphingomonas sp. Leaf23 TaxID=1735689 RepID=UPI000700222F|nr:PLP-dependent aminotransferase family protein [Sphingomonas sp. Leaf23]KQM88751.1 hypothetical protein ASE67_03220 [Sphingomonas sp. Leaf23]